MTKDDLRRMVGEVFVMASGLDVHKDGSALDFADEFLRRLDEAGLAVVARQPGLTLVQRRPPDKETAAAIREHLGRPNMAMTEMWGLIDILEEAVLRWEAHNK